MRLRRNKNKAGDGYPSPASVCPLPEGSVGMKAAGPAAGRKRRSSDVSRFGVWSAALRLPDELWCLSAVPLAREEALGPVAGIQRLDTRGLIRIVAGDELAAAHVDAYKVGRSADFI